MRTPEEVDLLGRVTHELGNLLAAIRLSAHLLGRSLRGRAAADAAAVERMAAQSGALLAQIRSLLSQPAERRVRIAPAEVLAKLDRALETAGTGAAELRVTAPGELPDVECDTDALHQVLAALVYASVDAVGAKGHVRVSAARADRGVVFAVEHDAGVSELDEPGTGEARGRALALELADAVLGREGGRVTAAASAPSARIEVRIPQARGRRPSA